jgi:hypothetical protein
VKKRNAKWKIEVLGIPVMGNSIMTRRPLFEVRNEVQQKTEDTIHVYIRK